MTTNVLYVTKLLDKLAVSKLIFLWCMKENVITNVLNATKLTHQLSVLKLISLTYIFLSYINELTNVRYAIKLLENQEL